MQGWFGWVDSRMVDRCTHKDDTEFLNKEAEKLLTSTTISTTVRPQEVQKQD